MILIQEISFQLLPIKINLEVRLALFFFSECNDFLGRKLPNYDSVAELKP